MRKSCYIVFMLMLSFVSFAQFNNDFMLYTDNKRSINLGAEYEINSDFLSNNFINKFYRGGYIDKGTKDDQLKRASGYNVVGGLVNSNLTAFFGKDSSKIRFMLGINHQQFFNATVTDDAYKLTFYGNKQFQGQSANLGQSEINAYAFQEFKLGFLIDQVDTTRAIMGMNLAYLKGQNFYRLRTNNTDLYTAPDASYIDFTTNASLSISDTASKKWYDFNGSGMSAEFFAETPYKSRLGPSKFFLSVSNLGFIRWSSNTLNYKTDSTFIFSGVHISDVFALQDSTLNAISLDSIVDNSTNLERAHASTNLPTTFLIIHKVRFSHFFEFTTGFRHLFNANYKPYLFTEGTFYINKNIDATAHLGFGGYGKLTGGLSVNLKIKDHFAVKLGSNYIQAYVLPKKSSGQGAYVSLSYKF